MSLHALAQQLQKSGRGEDTVLMHVTPGEVEGLQKLALAHGGSLTINPQTGLPEAGFLRSILPMAAAMAANMVVPGSGVIVGAGLGAMMNEKSPLMGAITGGLGGYGAGQLGTAFMGAGETALANQAMAEAAKNAAVEGITLPTDYASLYKATSAPSSWGKLSAGFTNNPMETIKGVGYLPLAGLAAPLVSGMMGGQKGLTNLPPTTPFQPQQYAYNPGAYNPQFGQTGQPYFTGQGFTRLAAGGGISSLGEYAAGGRLLQGDGDGMSDSIPAVIKGPKPQRAALADGEFVIPADVVSHLGNGSTKSGAKRLYSMMDKVRQARTGTKKQGRQINPDQFMPA